MGEPLRKKQRTHERADVDEEMSYQHDGGDTPPYTRGTNEQCRLLNLPQEIQDIIFDYGYSTIEGVESITKTAWNANQHTERRIKGPNYEKLPFPSPKVSEFLVSKSYFLAAAKAYIGNQISLFGWFNNDLITLFLTRTRINLPMVKRLGRAPNLKHVTVAIFDDDFSVIRPVFASEAEVSDDDCKALVKDYNVTCLSGLQEFHLETGECSAASFFRGAEFERREAMWEHNVRRLETYIRPIVTAPKTQEEDDNPRKAEALYPGSKVSLMNNELLVETEGSTKELTLQQLPDSADDMMMLLKKDGERVMDLIAKMKAEDGIGCQDY